MSGIRGGELPIICVDVGHNRWQGPGKVMNQGQVHNSHRQAGETTPLRHAPASQSGGPKGIIEKEEPSVGCHGTEDAKRDTQPMASLKDGSPGQGVKRLGDVHHNST